MAVASSTTALLSAVARLLQFALDAIEQQQRKERVENHDAQYAAIEADPVGWFARHFNVGLPAPVPADAGTPGTPDTGGHDSITLPRRSVERLSKYILDLERGYE